MDHGLDPEVWGRKNFEEKLDVGREDVSGTCSNRDFTSQLLSTATAAISIWRGSS
jgi:hypothetical protein